MDEDANIFRRDGHLSLLSIQRLLADEFDDDQRKRILEHASECEQCHDAIEAARARRATFLVDHPLPAAAMRTARAPRRPQVWRTSKFWTSLASLAAAVALAWVGVAQWAAQQERQADGDRIKGKVIVMEAFAHDGKQVRRLNMGATVVPGERIGFRVKTWRSGYLMIVGVDERRVVYRGFPQKGSSPQQAKNTQGFDIQQALRLDETLGQERLLAFYCHEPLYFEEARRWLEVDPLRPRADCAVDELVLHKKSALK